MHKSRVPLLWLIAITLGLLALMTDFISLTGFFLPVVASGVFFIMRLKKYRQLLSHFSSPHLEYLLKQNLKVMTGLPGKASWDVSFLRR